MIGVDIEDISRFRDKDTAFYSRIFTPLEIEYCNSFKNPYSHYAARFCAKEAAYKALSSYGINNILITQIEVYNDDNGCPRIRFINTDKQYKINISLSHEKDKAIAFAILDIKSLEKYTHHPCIEGDDG